ncbi:MAG: hypothetical protein HQK88_17050 [Nitrospirae bacterium]|nr:hypothetical protein [Nitrospirota bacterium]MBF0534090.1 hypothetical protein [Nitrospirota bacterium]MBF0618509.1 hypothetical protein [Nitrospirota bacterium]
MKIEDKICFIIAPIGEPESPVRDRSDKVLKFIIKPVTDKCGYCAVRADELPQPGLITTQIITHLLNDSILIADLSDHNPNVYYELAIRHVIKKPYVQLIEVGQKIPFDIQAIRTIYYNSKDLESVDKAKKDLEAQIRFIEQNPDKVDSPVSFSLDIAMLSKSSNPGDKDKMSMVHLMQVFRSEMLNLTSNIQAELKEMKQSMFNQQSGNTSKTKETDFSKLERIQKNLGIEKKILHEEDKNVQ